MAIELSPKQIVSELDKYIIGQAEAKKAVAIALRNRYRRSKLSSEMREEITPKKPKTPRKKRMPTPVPDTVNNGTHNSVRCEEN